MNGYAEVMTGRGVVVKYDYATKTQCPYASSWPLAAAASRRRWYITGLSHPPIHTFTHTPLRLGPAGTPIRRFPITSLAWMYWSSIARRAYISGRVGGVTHIAEQRRAPSSRSSGSSYWPWRVGAVLVLCIPFGEGTSRLSGQILGAHMSTVRDSAVQSMSTSTFIPSPPTKDCECLLFRPCATKLVSAPPRVKLKSSRSTG
ncbi:hypothetical protein BV22DRAFT_1040842 [Leucogyrophana mollusca]|uniref:Uncharacterized protein n=1 Tax=Leucogyrophana mollusca TaxID=85980 RepID=A0ACB8B1E3_9AGAM|nr:hypothetical protein BV22DRAFT_1040842 [Leucogyrophana mollusca]